MNKKILSLILSGLITTSFIGCTSKASSNGSNNKIVMDKEQCMNLTLNEPKSLDPAKTGDAYCTQIATEVFEGLTRLEQDENGKDIVKPAGAESWTSNDDKTVWKFKLRDFNWSDGKKVTAKDYEYSIKRNLNPKTASPIAYLLYVIKNAQKFNGGKVSEDKLGVKAIDDKTLEITLSEPCPYFLNLTYYKAMFPQRKDIVEKDPEKIGSEVNTMVYNGPFKATKWVHNNEIVLEKNDQYWDKDKVNLQKVSFKIIKETISQNLSLFNGSVDVLGVNDDNWIKKLRDSKKFGELNLNIPTTQFSILNEKSKLFSNANVRKAFSLALDREGLAKTVYAGDDPAYAWIPKSITIEDKSFREASKEEPVKDIAKEGDAKALLAKGLKELGIKEDPSKLNVNFLCGGTDQGNKELGDFFQENYKKGLGINVQPQLVEWPVFLDNIYAGRYDIATMFWTSEYNDPSNMFDIYKSDADIMPTFWKNKEYDQIVKKAKISIDSNERIKNYKKAEKMLLTDQAVIMPMVYRKGRTFTNKCVKNLMTPLFGSMELKYAYIQGRAKK
ncbi:peptide ABC transporter substrate-binding protein [Hathewaya limosa]|uniref:Oligopeptide transport system substrate-binding protein n=1 Tax=Hathewaya limosa TaxID=1536 RepID=A0ABU0JPN5_HATLI|nr:peptide ABC transporter substrate-binding protein [Hathewaya limosa]MDQ0479044.1 oligopeptide transport system substrate-binding protein [Hathewaya limosa]